MLKFLKNSILNEYQRWVLWLPVFQAAGVIGYFSLPFEPSNHAAIGLMAAAIILLKMMWRRSLWRVIFWAFLFFAIGFSSAKIRTEMLDAPKIEKEQFVTLSGNVEEIHQSEKGKRFLLNNLRIDELPKDKIPKKIRITVRTKIKGDIAPGDRVITDAILLPPPSAVVPNGYDFSRWAYFREIGATGYAVKTLVKLKKGGVKAPLDKTRYDLTNFIVNNSASEQAGAVTAALITGERGQISQDTYDAMRGSGLAHIIAISGLHMSLVSGFFFVLIRYGLGFVGGFSERINVKKLAAVIAIGGSFVYLLIAGMPSPATRACIMITVFLLAILLDRAPTPIRSVAFAAFIIMIFMPEQVLNPGFQMSFMAVIALVSGFEFIFKKFLQFAKPEAKTPLVRALNICITYPLGIVTTSVFAGLATAPYAAYHFNQYAAFGVLANLLAMPLATFWIMPMAVFALLLAPFGLAGEAFFVMSKGVELLIEIANWVSSMEGSSGVWKSFPAVDLALISFGMLWLFLWQTRWRALGFAPIFLGVFLATQTPTADIFIKENGKLWAVNLGGELHISNRRKTFASKGWYKSIGEQDFHKLDRQDVYEVEGKTVSFNCSEADLVFNLVKKRGQKEPPPCDKDELVTLEDLKKNGSFAIYIDGSNIWTENVEQFRGDRLWTR